MYSFPYQKKIIDEGEISDPRVDLEIKTIKGFAKITFLIDSGADVTTLPLKYARPLFNFRPDVKLKIVIGGVEGKGVNAYPTKLVARLGKMEFNLRCYFIDSPVNPLLGRLDFWDLFSVSFDNKDKKTIISPIE